MTLPIVSGCLAARTMQKDGAGMSDQADRETLGARNMRVRHTLRQLLDEVETLLRGVEALETPMLADDLLAADMVFEIERALLKARWHLSSLVIKPPTRS